MIFLDRSLTEAYAPGMEDVMTDRAEDHPAYRLGVAISLLRILLGEFGPTHEFDRAMVREFLDKEERIRAEFEASLKAACDETR